MLKTIKQPYKKVTNLDKDQTNRYSDKFENTSKCFDSTQYLQAKAKETLNKIKQSIIHQNLSKNKDDLENLVRYFKNKLKFNKDNLDLTIGLGNCLEKLQKINLLKELYSQFNRNITGSEIVKRDLQIFFIEKIIIYKQYDIMNFVYQMKNSKIARIYILESLFVYMIKKNIKKLVFILPSVSNISIILLQKSYFCLAILRLNQKIIKKQLNFF